MTEQMDQTGLVDVWRARTADGTTIHRKAGPGMRWRRRLALFVYRAGQWLGDRIDPWMVDE